MSFRDSLREIVLGTEGAVGGVVMAMDGIAVETFNRDGDTSQIDISLYGAEVAALLGQIRGARAANMSSGRVQEVDFFAERFHALVRFLSDEYFVAVAVTPGGNVGKGRYLMRVAHPDLVGEL